ncbi:MAG: hypothetical protein A2W31_16290 [Planctomycetes bacterium RBG_16_64_10]|nr:MAG: hypothetical protein A2W31_16290 [Planctomycetes bacterium RBG_16_64_10]
MPATDARNQQARTTRLSVVSCPSDGWNRPDHSYTISDAGGTPAEFARGNYAINGGSQYIYEAPGWLSNPRPNGLQFESDLATQSFALWGDGVAGINKCFRGCIEMHRLLGADYLQQLGMPCCDHCTENNQAASRSQHPGGVNIAMADGAVRFVTDDVDIGLWHVMHSRTTPADILAQQFDQRLDGTFTASAPAADSPASPSRRHDSLAEARVVNSIGMEFIRIPAGQFMMGLPNEHNIAPYPEEAPAHPVRITRPFLLGVHEVTQDQFAQVMGYNPSNDFGLHDMCGSVFEWTNDWFGLDYYRRAPRDDPQGPETGYLRVIRGWYWLFTGLACVANMSPPPWRKNPYIGFRVVCEAR